MSDKKESKSKAEKQEDKLKIQGTLDDVLKVSVPASKKENKNKK